ncbi:MerR family transcriptional regulator [Mobiluncus mulieris]|uniref:helix-turn-helix domain-containing protein n=1 Tax=Mobiluncus mulieris TaxID=2052 RepID=UPI000D9814A5|nr:helix-turn-helix domain-containing protein [Mobiluncus mulieris]SPX70154.1 Uncharacterised protein [Mobiluncus mulieris]
MNPPPLPHYELEHIPPHFTAFLLYNGGVAQLGQLTITEAADLYHVKPATWRAYVARGQMPKPINSDGTWDIVQLITRRDAPLPPELKTAALCQAYRINAAGAAWQTRTQPHLVQDGLACEQAAIFADSITPSGMTRETFTTARKILYLRKDYRHEVRRIPPVIDTLTRKELYLVIANRAGSAHPTALYAELGKMLIARGMEEVTPPWRPTPDFYSENPRKFLRLLEHSQILHTFDLSIQAKAA